MKIIDLANEWINYAQNDYDSAKYLTSMRPEPIEIICFHCQQAVEKVLKAYLISLGVRAPKTHDLDELLDLYDGHESIKSLRTITLPLNDYSVITRYPSIQLINDQDKIQALAAACKVIDTVKHRLGLE